MLEVGIGGRITITRGDSGSIAVAIVNGATGESYELQKNDTLVFTVKKNAYGNDEIIIEKTLVGTNVFDFEPDDTNSAGYVVIIKAGDFKISMNPVTGG